jgi:CRISPR/Cas system-associated endoribonuclease Cas2
MKDFGVRLQLSVFICRLDADGVARCRDRLRKILKTHVNEREPDDSLIIFERLNPGTVDCLLGARIEREPPLYEIF